MLANYPKQENMDTIMSQLHAAKLSKKGRKFVKEDCGQRKFIFDHAT